MKVIRRRKVGSTQGPLSLPIYDVVIDYGMRRLSIKRWAVILGHVAETEWFDTRAAALDFYNRGCVR